MITLTKAQFFVLGLLHALVLVADVSETLVAAISGEIVDQFVAIYAAIETILPGEKIFALANDILVWIIA